MDVKLKLGGTFAITGSMAESEECTLESVIRGHHIYKRIWRPLVGEVLTLEREEGNTHDRFTVSLLKDVIVVVLSELSSVSFLWCISFAF